MIFHGTNGILKGAFEAVEFLWLQSLHSGIVCFWAG